MEELKTVSNINILRNNKKNNIETIEKNRKEYISQKINENNESLISNINCGNVRSDILTDVNPTDVNPTDVNSTNILKRTYTFTQNL